jgi:hypothetical protein
MNSSSQSKGRKSIQICAVAIASALCWACHGEQLDPLLEKLRVGVERSENKLLNVRIEGTCVVEHPTKEAQRWETVQQDTVTAWYEGRPRGRRRIEHHKLVRSWADGRAPFLEEAFTTVFDGRLKQTLYTRSGPLNEARSDLRGDIEGKMDKAFMYECATGWDYSLWGAFESSGTGRLSSIFRRPVDQLRAQETSFNGTPCVRLQWLPAGVPFLTCDLDPARNYALLHCERAGGIGQVVMKWVVESFIEAAPGVYYPSKATKEFLSDDGNVEERISYEASSAVANDPNFSDDLFTLKWPKGTRVRDLVTSNTFVVTRDEVQARQKVEQAQPTAANRELTSPADPARHKGMSGIVGIVAGIVCGSAVALVGAACFIRRKKS